MQGQELAAFMRYHSENYSRTRSARMRGCSVTQVPKSGDICTLRLEELSITGFSVLCHVGSFLLTNRAASEALSAVFVLQAAESIH